MIYTEFTHQAQVGDYFRVAFRPVAQILRRVEQAGQVIFKVLIGGETEIWNIPLLAPAVEPASTPTAPVPTPVPALPKPCPTWISRRYDRNYIIWSRNANIDISKIPVLGWKFDWLDDRAKYQSRVFLDSDRNKEAVRQRYGIPAKARGKLLTRREAEELKNRQTIAIAA